MDALERTEAAIDDLIRKEDPRLISSQLRGVQYVKMNAAGEQLEVIATVVLQLDITPVE